jgi:hypothetical protein
MPRFERALSFFMVMTAVTPPSDGNHCFCNSPSFIKLLWQNLFLSAFEAREAYVLQHRVLQQQG